jgi:hypothetical protein
MRSSASSRAASDFSSVVSASATTSLCEQAAATRKPACGVQRRTMAALAASTSVAWDDDHASTESDPSNTETPIAGDGKHCSLKSGSAWETLCKTTAPSTQLVAIVEPAKRNVRRQRQRERERESTRRNHESLTARIARCESAASHLEGGDDGADATHKRGDRHASILSDRASHLAARCDEARKQGRARQPLHPHYLPAALWRVRSTCAHCATVLTAERACRRARCRPCCSSAPLGLPPRLGHRQLAPGGTRMRRLAWPRTRHWPSSTGRLCGPRNP